MREAGNALCTLYFVCSMNAAAGLLILYELHSNAWFNGRSSFILAKMEIREKATHGSSDSLNAIFDWDNSIAGSFGSHPCRLDKVLIPLKKSTHRLPKEAVLAPILRPAPRASGWRPPPAHHRASGRLFKGLVWGSVNKSKDRIISQLQHVYQTFPKLL